MHRPILGLVALLLTAPIALAEEPETAVPRLEHVGEVRVRVPQDAPQTLTALAPRGRYLALCTSPRSDDMRRADSWTTLTLIDLRKAEAKKTWEGLDMGPRPPAFSPGGRLFAFGTRKDAKTLTVHVRACATGQGVEQDVEHPAGSTGFAEVCGVSVDAQRVAIREPAGAETGRHLMVQDLRRQRRIARFPHFAEPYYGQRRSGVLLTGPLIAYHTRTPGNAGGTGYGLRVIELDTSRVVAETSGFVARTTDRFALTPDRGVLVNGTKDFDVEAIDLASGGSETVLDVDDLYSHFLEVVLSHDGKRVVAWSDERKLILTQDLAGGEPRRAELEFRAHVLGVSAGGRFAFVRVFDRGLVAVDLDSGTVAGTITEELADWARVTPDGAHLVQARDEDGARVLRIDAIRLP